MKNAAAYWPTSVNYISWSVTFSCGVLARNVVSGCAPLCIKLYNINWLDGFLFHCPVSPVLGVVVEDCFTRWMQMHPFITPWWITSFCSFKSVPLVTFFRHLHYLSCTIVGSCSRLQHHYLQITDRVLNDLFLYPSLYYHYLLTEPHS